MARMTIAQLVKSLQESPNMAAEVRLAAGTNLAGGAIAIAATDVVTITAHGLSDGDRVKVVSIAGGTGLTANTSYFVRDATANTFKLTATPGGTAIDITADTTQLSLAKQSVGVVAAPTPASPPADAPNALVADPGVVTLG
jgi:hypothetical protein